MEIITDIEGMSSFADKALTDGKSIGFVPTMGALHDGHLDLIKEARRGNECVVVSIFVNPVQFDRKDDLESYPVTRRRDHDLSRRNGVDVVFEPEVSAMYPDGCCDTRVEVDGVSGILCGRDRPGHFRGVATVVVKLFNIVRPHKAYFGEKDLQQSVVIRRLAKDLNIGTEIVVLPTVRDKDGMAYSSRNRLLGSHERLDALSICMALNNAKSLVRSGVVDSCEIVRRVTESIRSRKSVTKIDYVAVVDRDTLADAAVVTGRESILVAVWIGNTRLIDNCRL